MVWDFSATLRSALEMTGNNYGSYKFKQFLTFYSHPYPARMPFGGARPYRSDGNECRAGRRAGFNSLT